MAYIDTQYLGKCETCRHCVGEIKCNTYCDHGEEYSPNLSKIPEADVVEVVRCKDCKSNPNIKTLTKGILWCRKFRAEVHPNDFCSYGERKQQ